MKRPPLVTPTPPNAAPHADLIERVVAEVMRRLSVSPPLPLGEGRGEGAPLSTETVSKKLITLEDAIAHDSGPLHVAPRAVVTPAARDHFKQRGIEIVRGAAPTTQPAAKPASSVVIATAETAFEPASLVGAMRGAGHRVQQLARSGLAEVIAELADAVSRGGDLGIVATDEAALALCLANRRRGVRAVSGADRAGLARNVAAVGANLLVLDTLAVRPHLVRQLVFDFCQGAVCACPERYIRHLGPANAS